MPYCERCGSQLNPNTKFCTSCGAPQRTATANMPSVNPQPAPQYSPPYNNPYPPPPPPPPPPVTQAPTAQAPPRMQPRVQSAPTYQSGSEATVGVILLRKPKSLGRYDTFTGVLTTQRIIFAQMTSEMLTNAAQQARDQAKADGKGFWGQWADQLRGTLGYMNKYLTMPPQAILAETPGNFALYNNTIREVKIHLKGHYNDNQRKELEAEFCSTAGTYAYRMDRNSDFTDLLKRVYGGRVTMPFGYYSKSINIRI